jgi:hypothetical protein
MVSSTGANKNNYYHDDDSYDKAKALYYAAVHERGGSTLKDYYTIHEYRHRRATFVGNLPGHSNRFTDCFAIAKRDAEQIFDPDVVQQQLDVEEVRERELEMQFDVLLPLPTTVNTQTIDNFKTCPPIDGSREADEAEEDDEIVEDARDVLTPGAGFNHSTPGTSPVEEASTINKYVSDLPCAPEDPNIDPNLTVLPMLATVRPPIAGLLPATEVATPVTNSLSTHALINSANKETQHGALSTVAVFQTPSVRPGSTFMAHPGVSAYAGLGLPGSVKGSFNRHYTSEVETHEFSKVMSPAPAANMSASKPTAALNAPKFPPTSAIPTDTAEPPSKKLKTGRHAAQPKQAVTVATPVVSFTYDHSTNSLPAAASTNAVTLLTTPVAIVPAPPSRIDDIIAGRILPRSKAEAKDAAEELHDRLLAEYRNNSQAQSNKSNKRKSSRQSIMNTNPDPDFMPHYFSRANFLDSEEEDGYVRCICCVNENDPDMQCVCCESCEVWQHCGCVRPDLDGKSDEEMTGVPFLCTVCDPWAHRDVLRRVRAGEKFGKRKDKGPAKTKGKGQAKAGVTVTVKGKVQAKGVAVPAKGKARAKTRK